MSHPSEMTMVKCNGCSKKRRVLKKWVDYGKVRHWSCSRACEIAYAAKVAKEAQEKVHD